jgi:hypothetical protein
MKTNKTESYFKFSSFGFTNFANNSLIYVRESIFNKFLEESNINSTDLVLDVGVSAQDHQSSNFFEQYYPFKNNLTALGLGDFQDLNLFILEFIMLKEMGRSYLSKIDNLIGHFLMRLLNM